MYRSGTLTPVECISKSKIGKWLCNYWEQHITGQTNTFLQRYYVDNINICLYYQDETYYATQGPKTTIGDQLKMSFLSVLSLGRLFEWVARVLAQPWVLGSAIFCYQFLDYWPVRYFLLPPTLYGLWINFILIEVGGLIQVFSCLFQFSPQKQL